MDSYDKKSYRDDNYEPREYQSYKPDYKPAYSSYEKDNKDKSKKDSVSINKVNYINNNVNINGNNTGDINLGNKGAAEGYLGGYSSAGGGYSGEGYSKQYKGIECIINNNNANVVSGAGGGNLTDGDGNVTDTCEECFTTYLTAQEINALIIAAPGFTSLEQLCSAIDEFYQSADYRLFISQLLFNAASSAGISTDKINDILDYLKDVYGVDFPRPG